MKKISIYLYSDDGATVNCEIRKPTVDQLLALQALLDATDNATGSAVIGADTTTATGADWAHHNLKPRLTGYEKYGPNPLCGPVNQD